METVNDDSEAFLKKRRNARRRKIVQVRRARCGWKVYKKLNFELAKMPLLHESLAKVRSEAPQNAMIT